jgi:hypothetical protein
MVSAQWEEALSPLSSNPALFEDGFTEVLNIIILIVELDVQEMTRSCRRWDSQLHI